MSLEEIFGRTKNQMQHPYSAHVACEKYHHIMDTGNAIMWNCIGALWFQRSNFLPAGGSRQQHQLYMCDPWHTYCSACDCTNLTPITSKSRFIDRKFDEHVFFLIFAGKIYNYLKTSPQIEK